MRQKSGSGKAPAEQAIEDIRRATRKQYSPEEKIRIVLEGLPSFADRSNSRHLQVSTQPHRIERADFSVDAISRWAGGPAE